MKIRNKKEKFRMMCRHFMKDNFSFCIVACVSFLCLLSIQPIYAVKKPEVVLGVDRLLTPEYAKLIKGKRIAIVTNNASVNHEGKSTIDCVKAYPHAQVVALFSPEHGLNVSEDDRVSDKQGAAIPVYSLYGPRKSPTAEQLAGVDLILFDLETVGLRYYTYISTLALVMKAAKQNNIPIVVLDRVNPLGGLRVDGFVLDKKYEGGFAGYYPIPTRYGLSMGELARFYNRYFKIDAALSVVPLKNWGRDSLFEDTGLKWRAPSPALPTFEQAFLYSIFGPFESLSLAVGRSQTNKEAFRRYGAPWMSKNDAEMLVSRLKQLRLSGLDFKRVSWTPNRAKYKGKQCYGFAVIVTDLKSVRVMRSFVEVAAVLKQQFPRQLGFSAMDAMIGSSALRHMIEKGVPVREILAKIKDSQRDFMRKRKTVLLYS